MHLILMTVMLATIGPVSKDAPNRQPQMASSPTLTALVFGSENSIWFTGSKDGGHSFSPPLEIAKTDALALGRHRGPRVAFTGKTIVVSAVYGHSVAAGPHAHGLPSDGDLVAWRSEDEGRTWSAPVVINDVPAAAREGLHAMAATAQGDLAAAWLDLRTKGTRLYGAYSHDHGMTWSKNVLLFEAPQGTICQCCAPSLAAANDDGVRVMFRNVVDGNRDMYLLKWPLGSNVSAAPVKAGQGSWHLDACPMDGGGVADSHGAIVTAWRRDQTVFLVGAGAAEQPLGTGKDVALAVTKQGSYVSWTGANGIEVHVPEQTQSIEVGKGAYSTLSPMPGGQVAVAWEQDGVIRIAAVD